MNKRIVKKRSRAFSPVEKLVMVAIIGLLALVMVVRVQAQQQITSYFAAPQQPNGTWSDTNDCPYSVTNGTMWIVTTGTNIPNNVYVIRQNVGLSIFDTFTVKNATSQASNGVLQVWEDTSADGTPYTLTGTTNGVWASSQAHWAVINEPWTCPADQTNTYTYWTNIPNTYGSNIRDVRLTGLSNNIALPLTLNQHVYSQSWQ